MNRASRLPDDLYFHAGEAERLRRQINAALNSGKHIIITGPPGTGKSKLAKHIAAQASEQTAVDDYQFTTATAEWTTFDTIGGYVPSMATDQLEFDPRLFLQCFRQDDGTITNQWLLIDELNRANIDKALGPLFSVLAGDSVQLPYERDTQIQVDWVDQNTSEDVRQSIAETPDRFPVTPAWRIIGTMNTFDKTSLYELSYAFMRRFSFVHVGPPELMTDTGTAKRELLDPTEGSNYATVWQRICDGLDETIEEYHEPVAVLWAIINQHRTIGPAIVLDIFRHLDAYEGGERTGPLTSAIVSLVFPQLEGMRQADQKALLEALAEGGSIMPSSGETPITVDLPVNMEYLRRKARDMYELDFED